MLVAATSAVCIVAPSIETLTGARFVQALAVSVGQVAGRAVIRDTHDTAGTARMLAFTMVVIGLTSAITPVAGGFLAVWLGCDPLRPTAVLVYGKPTLIEPEQLPKV